MKFFELFHNFDDSASLYHIYYGTRVFMYNPSAQVCAGALGLFKNLLDCFRFFTIFFIIFFHDIGSL